MVSSQTIKNAQEGNEIAIQEIFSKFKNIIQMRTKNYFFYGGDREDVILEAMIGLLKAINVMMKIKQHLLQHLLFYV